MSEVLVSCHDGLAEVSFDRERTREGAILANLVFRRRYPAQRSTPPRAARKG